MHLKVFLWLGILLTSFFGMAAEEEKIGGFELAPLRMNIGGSAKLPMSVNRHNEFHLGIEVAPAFGVFLAKQLELRTNIHTRTQFVFSEPQQKLAPPIFWGCTVTSIYYFKTSTILWPYVGGGVGFDMMNWNIFSLGLLLELPVGMLVALGNNIALDIGMPISVKISIRSLADTVSFPIGVIGLRYYFN